MEESKEIRGKAPALEPKELVFRQEIGPEEYPV
jgi:hypothetical protein